MNQRIEINIDGKWVLFCGHFENAACRFGAYPPEYFDYLTDNFRDQFRIVRKR